MCIVYLLLNKGTNSEVHDGWKSNLEPVQKGFFQSWKNAKTTDVHIGCNRIQVEFEYSWGFNCLSYLYNLAQYSNRGPQLLQRMTFAHQKTNNDAHQFTCYCQLYSYRRGNDKISLSHLFTDWGRLGHGASCWASYAHSYRARSQSGDIHSTDWRAMWHGLQWLLICFAGRTIGCFSLCQCHRVDYSAVGWGISKI